MELTELQAAAYRINTSCNQSYLDTRAQDRHLGWMWDALDIDGGALQLDLTSSYTGLTSDDAFLFNTPEEMRRHV